MPETHSFGDDEDEALLRAADALETALEFYIDAGRDLPKASPLQRGQHTVHPNHREIWPIRSTCFKRILAGEFFALTGKGCNGNATMDALNTIEARAIHQGEAQPVHLRVARINDLIYLDLVDNQWRVIEITGQGWRMLDRSPVNFVRKNGMSRLPIPADIGDSCELREFINTDESGFKLISGWILGALRGTGPYPILVLQGEHGSGKSTLTNVLRSFIDPSTVPLRPPPREVRDLLVSAVNNHLIALDNLSSLRSEISDSLCRLATGGDLDARKLYTDLDQTLIDIQRPVLVNGIDDLATRSDLADRSVILNLPNIDPAKRLDEKHFW
ncbi:MAG: type II toxin-antitoxin system HicB family antitoxin, partial [Methylococcales bacterium]